MLHKRVGRELLQKHCNWDRNRILMWGAGTPSDSLSLSQIAQPAMTSFIGTSRSPSAFIAVAISVWCVNCINSNPYPDILT